MSGYGRVPERVGGRGIDRLPSPSFTTLKRLSFVHSTIYLGLLACWIGGVDTGLKTALGWGHGWGWILMSLLAIAAVRARVIPLWLGVCVAVVGAVGPFVGSIGFVAEERRRARRGDASDATS